MVILHMSPEVLTQEPVCTKEQSCLPLRFRDIVVAYTLHSYGSKAGAATLFGGASPQNFVFPDSCAHCNSPKSRVRHPVSLAHSHPQKYFIKVDQMCCDSCFWLMHRSVFVPGTFCLQLLLQGAIPALKTGQRSFLVQQGLPESVLLWIAPSLLAA